MIWEPAEKQGTAEVREAKRARSQRRKRGEAGKGREEEGASWAEAAVRRGFRGAGLSVRSCACVMLFRAVCYGGVTDLVGYRKSMSFLSRKAYTRESLRLVSGVH